MANDFVTQEGVSNLAVPLLTRSLTLGNTVARVAEGEFTGPSGGKTIIRVPKVSAARTLARGGTIVVDDVDEDEVELTVDLLYKAARITEHELALDLVDYGRQIVAPMVESVGRAIEGTLASIMNGLAPDEAFAASASESDTKAKILAIIENLDTADVPADGRFIAVSPDIKTRLLSVTNYVDTSAAGSTDGLRRGVVGDLYGATVVVSNSLAAGTAIGYHRSGFAMGTFPGSATGELAGVDEAIVRQDGFAMKTVAQYNPTNAAREQLLMAFAGAAAVDAGARVYKIGEGS